MASSRENRGQYQQRVEHDEYEEEYPRENSDGVYNRHALYNSEYTEEEGEYEEREYQEGNYEESDYIEYTDPDSPTSPSNGHPFPSPPPSPPTDDCYEDEDHSNDAKVSSSNIPPPPPSRTKKLPSVPNRSQVIYIDEKSPSQMPFRPSAPTPTHQKRKINYFTIGKSLTSRLGPKFKSFKKSHAKEEGNRNVDSPLPEPPQQLPITLPSLAPSSPISHQLPAEYLDLDFDQETDNASEVHTTPELTMDDLYHLVLNMQKGFQLQVDEMNTQIKDLKREIKKLKGEESEEEESEEEEDDLEDFMMRSPSRTATSVRSVTKEMERYGGEGKWFHSEYS
ncbi:9368_t:CDS:1 [Funneliformis geosporum]|uniref:18340_t:CDS:1 n=1 Tax=Funneliformis geosporum TaxID=1117311 RepID=A0A9W4SXS6_9GLOM|nr:9368_t:CDS:1 [Funneliformis geosporum]CAI2184507.1 18340_t:CDS:1 [Funneliformis geosporum]